MMESANRSRRRHRTQVAKRALTLTRDYALYRCVQECETNETFVAGLNGYRQDVLDAAHRLAAPADVGTLEAMIRRTAREIERRYNAEFASMCDRLPCRPDTIRSTFSDVTREIFRDGINYGRIASLFAFSGAFAVHGIKHGIHDMIAVVPILTADFVDEYLAEWIDAHGGWDGFVAHFRNHPRIDRSTAWEKMIAVGGMVAAGAAGLALAALRFT
ncbi:apoptosis regulator Bcl-2-like [Oscarella lobularis]|uniref:apoptosis regulator Bcl-2-like n=1 Tax=Oscarella lobularis TaxID=121494 RepID=UPI003313DF9D